MPDWVKTSPEPRRQGPVIVTIDDKSCDYNVPNQKPDRRDMSNEQHIVTQWTISTRK